MEGVGAGLEGKGRGQSGCGWGQGAGSARGVGPGGEGSAPVGGCRAIGERKEAWPGRKGRGQSPGGVARVWGHGQSGGGGTRRGSVGK